MSFFVSNMKSVVQQFRILDQEMQAQTMLAFPYIAERERVGIETRVLDVGEFLDVTSASATRNVQALSRMARHEKPGHDLVVLNENPLKRTEKLIKLTEKGRHFLKMLESHFKK